MKRNIEYLNKNCKYFDIIEVNSFNIIVRTPKPYTIDEWNCDCKYFIEKFSTSIEEEQEASYEIIDDRFAIIYI